MIRPYQLPPEAWLWATELEEEQWHHSRACGAFSQRRRNFQLMNCLETDIEHVRIFFNLQASGGRRQSL